MLLCVLPSSDFDIFVNCQKKKKYLPNNFRFTCKQNGALWCVFVLPSDLLFSKEISFCQVSASAGLADGFC